MAETCENNLTITGNSKELNLLLTWFKAQNHEQAPDAKWAALYNLEQEAKKLPKIEGIYEGSPDHAYGILILKEFIDSENENGRILLSFPSKHDPCLCIVQVLAIKYPTLTFDIGFTNFDSGQSGTAGFVNGTLASIEIEEADSDDDFDSEEEDSDW